MLQIWIVKSVATLDLSNFDTSKVTMMRSMFLDMDNLITLDITNFTTEKVKDASQMFATRGLYDSARDKLERIYVKNDFSEMRNIDFVFKNRRKLRGGLGSYLQNPDNANRFWLRVDRPGVQGYFTRKP